MNRKTIVRDTKNVYLPAIKNVIAKPYSFFQGELEKKQFEAIYEIDHAIDDDNVIDKTVSYADFKVVLSYEEAVAKLKPILMGHEPQIYGTCVAHTMKNINKLVTKMIFGEAIELSEHDVYLDRTTRKVSVDNGMYVDLTFKRVEKKGIAIKGVIPTATKISDLYLKRGDFPDVLVQPFRVGVIKSFKPYYVKDDFDLLWSVLQSDFSKKGIRPMQCSIDSYSGWWGGDLPTATGKILGGHSMVMINIPFTFKGERAFFAIDSSYRRFGIWRVGAGVRIVTEKNFAKGIRVVRTLNFVDDIDKKLTKPRKDTVFITKKAHKGDRGNYVEVIQKTLIQLGYDIPAGATGFYGGQTSRAVLQFQLDHKLADVKLLKLWGGDYCGDKTIVKLNELLS